MFDAGMLRAIIYEINCFIREGAKVEKVYQPLKDEIDLVLRSAGENRRLCINAGSNAPRLSFSDMAKENPVAAPMFCMLLRKHLSGARLVLAEQIGFERVARLSFCGYDEMGYETKRYLIAEIMGKYSNLILLDENEKIISALKIIDFSTSRLRQVLPTMKYELPPAQDKKNPLEETENGFFESLSAFPTERIAEKFISLTYLGISSSLAREIAFRATKEADTLIENTDKNALCRSFFEVVDILKSNSYTPTIVYDNDGAPVDYFFLPVRSYNGVGSIEQTSTFGQLLDKFFGERDRRERIKQRATDILQLLNNAESRLSKKIALQREELAECERGEEYKKKGDLITANLYMLKRGMASFIAYDYELDPPTEIEIALDTRLSPSQNAQRMYKYYNKAKSAKIHLTSLIEKAEGELSYIESVRAFLERAESEEDLNEIRSELYSAGYASKMKNYTPQKQMRSRPMEFKSDSGYKILCGRNNLQNELLTFKVASKGDLWFHAKGVAGSHVILVCDGEEPSEKDYTQAAEIAADYSKASGAPVAVDYTRVKNIKKPSGSHPGFVIYKTNYTAFVTPRATTDENKGE